MAGIDNNSTIVGEWMPPSPSRRNFFSNLMAEEEFDLKPFPNEMGGPFVKLEAQGHGGEVKEVKEEDADDGEVLFPINLPSKPNTVNAHRPSLTERRAARAGFAAPTIDTEQIRSANFSSSSSEIRSPYLTIPPGLSPTTLLDSPVFLSNSMAQLSPTTGTYPFAQCGQANQFSISASASPDKSNDHPLEGISPESSDVKLHVESSPFSFSSGGNQHIVPCIGGMLENANESNLCERKLSPDDFIPNHSLSNPITGKEECSPPPDNSSEEETKAESSLALGALAEDGYNWRKYGQKHVKGSEYPRSYYKCTFTNCPVKKKVERNHEGQVTEIVYKGAHSHPKPPPSRRSGVPSSHPFNDYQLDGHDCRNDSSIEATPPGSGVAELCEAQEAGEVSSTLSNDDDEDRATHGSISVGCDGEGEESESKRRKLDACAVEMSSGSRAVREPRVVVQTTSEVDILDDGYRWRKYGQKVVKGNPNPRSYYKCTHPGCSVRKHVERASHDLKSVITTYEGKHNHEVPVARSGGGGGPTNSAAPSAPAAAATSLPQPPIRTQEGFPRYDTSAPLAAAFSLAGRDRVGAATAGNFSFTIGPQGFQAPNLTMPRFGPPMHLTPINAYLGSHHHVADAVLVVPKGEPKEEPATNPGLNMPNGASVYYHQLMGRMPLGPQL